MPGPTLIVHGHFYQPPRENPWTETVAAEPSAAPHHDWNERIHAESYRPNAHARIVDDRNRVVALVNNYAHLSFDVGPTLFTWLDDHAPATAQRIAEGDAAGRGGLAQPWFHVIVPLATERDARTLIRWGLADFRHRFGREAKGVWLPETAVDEATLALLVDEGVSFTILAPTQADGEVDTRRPYRWEHPDGSGRALDVVFFDGPLSHAAAFEGLSSQALVDRVVARADGEGLVCVATDGETFGHHHRYADRALAYALTVEAPRRGIEVTTVERFLEANAPTGTVRVRESAWSCAHGVGRWKEDCGCATGGEPGWSQQWRGPLREALDILRDFAAEVFERRGKAVLDDPWAARDAYVDVLLGRRTRDEFVRDHVRGDPVEAFTLLEAQRHALAMYTSCGWFFNDLAGIETLYVLRLAARVVDHLDDLGEEAPVDRVLDVLARARSNVPTEGDGARIWARHVEPARVRPERVVAHLALVELLQRPVPEGAVGGHAVEWVRHGHHRRGGMAVCSGQVALRDLRTGRRTEHVYAALRVGALDVFGATRPADPVRDPIALDAFVLAFRNGAPLPDVLRLMGHVGATEFDLSWALPDAADQIVADTARSLGDRYAAAFDRLFEDHRPTLDALIDAGMSLAPDLATPAALSLARRFEAALGAHLSPEDEGAADVARSIVEQARRYGVRVDTPAALAAMSRAVLVAVERAVADGADPTGAHDALALLALAHDLDLHPDVDRAQELVYDALLRVRSPALQLLGTALHLAVERLADPA